MLKAPADVGAPFLRFNPITGWPLEEGSELNIPRHDGPLQLAIAGLSAISMTEPTGTFGGRTLPRGLAITSNGQIFLADPAARVIWTARVNEGATEKPQNASSNWPFQPLWPARPLPQQNTLAAEIVAYGSAAQVPADPYTLLSPTDVAMAPNGDLVILDPAAHRILVIAFPTAALRHVIHVANGAPTAICFDHHGRAYIADPSLKTTYRYDRNWRHEASFVPVFKETPGASSAPLFIAAHADCGCRCNGKAGACEHELPCGSREPRQPVVYTLDETRTLNAIYTDGSMVVATDHDALSLSPKALTLADNDALLYADPAMPHHEPICILGLELANDGRHAGTGLPILARPRRIDVPRSGHFITEAIDAGVPGFSWDRIALTLDMPENTRLGLQTMTSDSAIEPDRLAAVPGSAWSLPVDLLPDDLPEVLVQSMPGRYLWLRVDLSGDGTRTPVIHELDVFGPRRSTMKHLPAPFHDDSDSAHFLDRFLSYFDTIFAEITTRNRDIAMLFDPDVTPASGGFLAWLGAWFDLQFLAEWDEGTRREMIREAMSYFRIRGTVEGLRKMVQWHTGLPDPLPQIIEHFRLPTGSGADPAPMIGGHLLDTGNVAHKFTVVLPASALSKPGAEQRLNDLIAASVPAHCHFEIRSFIPGIVIGSQSSIGVDTLLGSLDPTGLGQGILGLTFSTAGPEATGPVTVYPNASITFLERGYPC